VRKGKNSAIKVAKSGGHKLFEQDRETAAYVAEMLMDREDNGMDAVGKYPTKFDAWNPLSL